MAIIGFVLIAQFKLYSNLLAWVTDEKFEGQSSWVVVTGSIVSSQLHMLKL